MREEPGAVVDAGSGREDLQRSGQELDRKFRVAMVLYAILAAVSWFILDGKIFSRGKVGGVEVGSTAYHRCFCVAHRGSDEGGEDSPRREKRQPLAFSL